MTTTTTTEPTMAALRRPRKAIARGVGIALVGVTVAVSAIALTDDERSQATRTGPTAPTHVTEPTSPGVTVPVDVRGMSPAAAEQWLLTPDPVDVRGMSPAAAEQWLANR